MRPATASSSRTDVPPSPRRSARPSRWSLRRADADRDIDQVFLWNHEDLPRNGRDVAAPLGGHAHQLEELTAPHDRPLFNRLDARVADVVAEGIRGNAYVTRNSAPRLDNSRQMVYRPAERYIPVAVADHGTIIELVRTRLRSTGENSPPQPGTARSRSELHAAIVHHLSDAKAAWVCDACSRRHERANALDARG